MQLCPAVQEAIAILGSVILPTFESVETYSPEQFLLFVRQREEQGDVHRFELLNGRIVMNPPAGWPHGTLESRLHRAIANFVESGKLGQVLGSSQGYRSPSGDLVEPDIAFVSTLRWSSMRPPEHGSFLEVVPDLMVEILSGSTRVRDRSEKRTIYERNGVLEYWLVDPLANQVTVLPLEGPQFRGTPPIVLEGTAESRVLPGLRISVRDLFHLPA